MDITLYDELWQVEQRHWWFQARRRIVWSLACRYLPDVAGRRLRICDLGCGTGGNIAELADRHDVIGIECSPAAIRYARCRLGGRVQQGSLPDDVPLPPGSFDLVMLTDVLEHIEADRRAADVAMQLLQPGGIAVATVPAYPWLYAPRDAAHHHVRRYSKQSFRRLWHSPQAAIRLLSHYNTLLFAPAAVVRLASKIVDRRGPPGDLTIPPRTINRSLALMMGSEAHLLGRVPLPFGLSLVAVVQKRAGAATARAAA